MESLLENLKAIVGRDAVLSERDELLVYECDGLPYHKYLPRAVVFPKTTKEVSEVVKELNRAKVSFAPRGAGTGLSGGALTVNHGVIIELAKMKRILKIDVVNRLAVVEVGLVNAHLSRAVAQYGLHYAPDPSSQMTCTIGGNLAENSGGIHCLKYGVTTDHVLGARVVLSDGNIVDLNLNAGGYDLLGVFVGSEGTFGLATEATLKLTFNPPAIRTILAEFTDIDKASRAVSAIIAAGMIPAALEMVDGETIRAVEASLFKAGLPLDSEAALLIELDGLEAGIDAETEKAENICRESGARSVRRSKDEYERKKLWAARKGAIGALGRVTPDLMLQDAVVPRSRLPEVLAETYRVAKKYKLRVANVFHAGDGNLHPIICFDSRYRDDVEGIREAGREIMQKCVAVGGTITGEHGVGLDKSEYLPLIFNDDDMETMLSVRAAFDPTGLCNPGKIIPMLRGCGEKRANVTNGEGQKGSEGVREKGSKGVREWGSKGVGESIASEVIVSERGDVRRKEFVVEDAIKGFAAVVGDESVVAESDESVLVFPSSVEEASECLRLASRNCWPVVPAGARIFLDAGNRLKKKEVVISTGKMNRIISHEPADLIATVEAGCTLSTLNQQLAQKGQWLPLDPPDDGRATIGGIIATGGGGPLSFSYGAPRAHILGMRVALADGRIVKAGGRVVKNVAGYDLCKLFTGSYGTLCLILEATFKLKPLPEADRTVAVFSDDWSLLIEKAREMIESPLLPAAVELVSSDISSEGSQTKYVLLVRFTGAEKTVEFQIEKTCEIFKGIKTKEIETYAWKRVSEYFLKKGNELVWRASVLPSVLNKFLDVTGDSRIQAGIGDGRLRVIETTEGYPKDKFLRLNAMRVYANSLIIERAPAEIKESFDSFGISDDAINLNRRIKTQLDPLNLLNTL